MPLFRKKADPISARSKELSAQIVALENQIRRLSTNIEHGRPEAPIRSGNRSPAAAPAVAPARAFSEPVFEPSAPKHRRPPDEMDSGASHYNDLGVRKYDLLGALRRASRLLSATPAENPKLITYLAAGSVKGLRPLRYEKRVARNRFIFLSAIFALILWGLIAAFFSQT